MDCPTTKRIGDVSVRVEAHGWPYWTRIDGRDVNWLLNHEEARDLLYAMQRVVAWLDAVEARDAKR